VKDYYERAFVSADGRGRRLEETACKNSLDNLVWEHDSANRIPERLSAR